MEISFLISLVIVHIEKGCPSYLMEDDDFRIVVFIYVGFFVEFVGLGFF